MTDTFTCARCKRTFDKERSDEEALAETHKVFGSLADQGPMSVLCDDCYQAFMRFWRARQN
jgi:hypothetical protein